MVYGRQRADVFGHEQWLPQRREKQTASGTVGPFGRIKTLTDNPDIGRVVPEFSSDNIRELIHKPFRVVYLRESSTIYVIRVWRSERILELP